MPTKTFFSLFVILLVVTELLAYPSSDEDVKFLKKQVHLKIDIAGGELTISEEHTIEKIFYKDFQKNARHTIYFSDFDPLTDFKAVTRIPFKSKTKSIKVTETHQQDIVQPGIFYGGYKKMEFVFPALQPEAVGSVRYTKKITDPHLLSPFYFKEREPIDEVIYQVSFPEEVQLAFKLFGEETEKLSFQESTINGLTTYTWRGENIPPYRREKDAPSRSFITPHIVILINSYSYKSQEHEVLTNTDNLYEWYYKLTTKIEKRDNSALQQQVKSILENKSPKLDSAEAIFKWVQKNIKYVAFEDGMAGFIPRAAADVLSKRYGDCKDMANLLKEMMAQINVESHLTWIGTRAKPYSYAELPCTIADNHMICAIRQKEHTDFTFLDATNPYGTFGYPTSMIQGKEALVGKGPTGYEIVKVPVMESTKNQRLDTIKVSLEENELVGSLSSHLTGYIKNSLEFDRLKAEVRNETEYLRDYFSIGSNNIRINEEMLQGIGNEKDTAIIQFNIKLPNYAKSIGKKIYLNLNLNKELPGEEVDLSTRENLLETDFKFIHSSIIEFKLPEGVKVSFIPEDRVHVWNHGALVSSYQVKDEAVYYTKRFVSDYLYLSKEDFEEWNQSLKDLTSVNQESITLEYK